MIEKPICPFCGTDKLTFHTRLSSTADRHYIGQFHCRKCGARSPIVHGKEWLRFYVPLSKEETLELKEKALQAFQPRKEEAPDLWLGCSPDNAAKNCVSLSKAIFERDKRK